MIRTFLPVLALLYAGPALAQQQSEFDLPETAAPSPSPAPAPTGGGQVQGPVDDSGVIPIGPRVIRPTPTPAPITTAAPTAAPTTAPTIGPRAATQPAPRTTAPARSPRPASQDPVPDIRLQSPVGPVPAPTASETGPSITDPIVPDDGAATDTGGTTNAASGLPSGLPTSPPNGGGPIEAQSGEADPATPVWWWIVAAFLAIAALAAAAIAIRRKQAQTPIVAAPKVSPGLMPSAAPKHAPPEETNTEPKPESKSNDLPAPAFVHAKIPAQSGAAAKPSPAATRPIAPLGLETQVVRMQRSLRAITVTAQVAVTNRGPESITNAVLQGDLVGASKAKPLGEQLANAAAELGELEPLGTLEPGERREATVQVRKELPEIEGIQQGNAVVFIPLLRIRFAGDGATPLASTVLVGHPPERSGGKPTPFLADAPPQNYDNVVGRALG